MKNTLKDFGFKKNWIYESIITTEYEGRAHAAPMGVSTSDMKRVRIKVYKTAESCRNISETGFFTVNLTCDLQLFYSSLFEKKRIRYARLTGLVLPVLKGADAFIEARVVSERDEGEKIAFTGEIMCQKRKSKKEIKLINRAQYLAFEALVKSSKILAIKDPAMGKHLLDELRYTTLAASKTAPGSSYARIASKLSSLFRD